MRRMVSTLLVLAAPAALSQMSPQPCERVLNVGAWNIQWLGNPAAGKRAAQIPQDIASYIAASRVDVLGLAEISQNATDAGGRKRNAELDAAFGVLNVSGAKWQYEIFAKRDGARDPQDQWSGIAWNAAVVTVTGGPWKLDARIDEAREAEIRRDTATPEGETVVLSRWPHAVKFSAGDGLTDVVVVPVHLKSNIGGDATARARAYEAELILDAVTRLRSEHRDGDLIIVGDFNMLSTKERAGAVLAAGGLKDCNERDIGTHLPFNRGERAAPFDRVFVMSGQPETKNSCPRTGKGADPLDFKVVRPADWRPGTTNTAFRKLLSDHLLVRTGICVRKDDD